MSAEMFEELEKAVAFVRGEASPVPKIGIILGSGLGPFADTLRGAVALSYQRIPGFPVSRVPGHAGRLVIGKLASADVTVAAMQGRVHGYEGWTPGQVAFGTRVLGRLGIELLVVTNAAGGINPTFAPADLVRISDHLNLTGQNPLTGVNDDRLGVRFPDLTHAYDPKLGQLLEQSAKEIGVTMKSGVYACVPGPSYETPAEIRMLRTMGADLVGMSTVPEVIAARHMGVRVCGISVVTNYAAGIAAQPLSHEEVGETAERVRERFLALLSVFLPRAAGIVG